MSTTIGELIASIRRLEAELEEEIRKDLQAKAERFRYQVEHGQVRFERAARELHARVRRGALRFFFGSSLRVLVSAPIIYAMLVPLVLLDLSMVVYQQTCFRLYGIARVDRGRYVVLDRRHLGYLNWIEKLNCDYCSYANGLVAFAREIAARTEQYWCPIKHARRVLGPHAHYRDFLDYGDAEAWRKELPALRAALREAGD